MMKQLLLILVFANSAIAQEATAPSIRHAVWDLEINNHELVVAFDRKGMPGVETDRKNMISVYSNNEGAKTELLVIQAASNEDFRLKDKWFYRLTDQNGIELALMILDSESDGENPTAKPIYIVTDGKLVKVKRYSFDEKYLGNPEKDIHSLISEFPDVVLGANIKDAIKRIGIE